MHVFGDNKAAEILFADFKLQQMRWNYPKGFATRGLCGAGNIAHQAHIACTIDQSPAPLCKPGAQSAGLLGINRLRTAARAAVYTD